METIMDVKELWINGSEEDWKNSLPLYFENSEVKKQLDLERKMCSLNSQDINILRRKAEELNNKFRTEDWTPRKVDMILWAIREERQN